MAFQFEKATSFYNNNYILNKNESSHFNYTFLDHGVHKYYEKVHIISYNI